jgi:hypothetical protein
MVEFRPIGLSDQNTFRKFLAEDEPNTSELTFTNIFMWRCRYRPVWTQYNGCLLIIMRPKDQEPFGLPPIGPGDKREALKAFTIYLRDVSSKPRMARASKEFVQRFVDRDAYEIQEDLDNSDYVYLAKDLIKLPGNRYHRKKNHLNRFIREIEFEYHGLDDQMVNAFLDLQEDWCELKDCVENPELFEEDLAVYEALKNYKELGFKGGAIVINSKVEAFTLGELLNHETAVIHIEKANPHIPGLYAAINQMFCAREWTNVKYVNREQDLGVEGLRKAKLSYYPDHMVEKFILLPRD